MDIRISGRHVIKDGVIYLCFSGSFAEFVFEGSELTAKIKTDMATDPRLVGYAGLFVNGEYKGRIKLDKPEGEYVLFKSEEKQKALIRLMRFSENNFGKLGLVSLQGDGIISPTSDPELKIEFIGDSITCGYGVEASGETESFCTETENPAKAYAVMTAESLKADFELVSWSGNGLLTQYIPPERDEPDLSVPLMPEIYKLQDYGGYAFEGYDEPKPYDFGIFKPDITVINLGTNDASYTRKKPERVKAYGDAYTEFLKFVRSKRQDSKIICTLGIMNEDLCDELEARVKEFGKDDKNVYFLRQEIMRKDEPYGADWHPGEKAQKRIADQLTEFIKGIV